MSINSNSLGFEKKEETKKKIKIIQLLNLETTYIFISLEKSK